MICPNCQASTPDGSRFCSSCAAPLLPPADEHTRTASSSARAAGLELALARAPGVGRLASDTVAAGGFTPGAILVNRYRIVGLLGRGGMGEVYRADDLKLGQPVALKFLPRYLANDPVRRERFIGEVRIARQLSHPNLCRVYDIGELEDQYFLTMEYVDGEDLASLLRRIGLLHGPKALDIARQLCAGLAAAHEKGVLHRDLKPANVMIDGRGRVRITDFGLALAASDTRTGDEMSGTPAYMAPEQLAGHPATTRSDIHALGLVLYEIYTGTRTFHEGSLAERRAHKPGDTPVAPSEIVRDIDPVVERVILRCIEPDPLARPSSVAQVAAALPGSDPLAAAIAAGETPSPEMVAAAGSGEGLSARNAWMAIALVLAGAAAAAPLMQRTQMYGRVQLDRPAEALADRARQILAALGHKDPPADSTYGFVTNQDLVDYIARRDSSTLSPGRWEHLPAETIRFWYRQRPVGTLVRTTLAIWGSELPPSAAGSSDPPMTTGGEAIVWLDTQGRLLEMTSVPADAEDPAHAGEAPDWSVLFREAGLDVTRWTPIPSRTVPPIFADARAAWSGTPPERPHDQIRLEAGAHAGSIVSLRRVAPWTGTRRDPGFENDLGFSAASASWGLVVSILGIVTTVAAVILARRNLRLGRGDRRNAARVAWLQFSMSLATWLLGEHHALDAGEFALLLLAIGRAATDLGFLWVAYLALEPFVRRRWPHVLISWNRLLGGELRDPRVGRDLLVGCALGTTWLVALLARSLIVARATASPVAPLNTVILNLFVAPTRNAAAVVLDTVIMGIGFGMGVLILLLLVRAIVRKEWLAVVLFGALLSTSGMSSESPGLTFLLGFAMESVTLLVLLRFGLVSYIAAFVSYTILKSFPLTTDLSAWYAGTGFAALLLVVGVAVMAFIVSVRGRPIFGQMVLED